MASGQASSWFPSPPRWAVPWITRATVWVYRRSSGRFGSASAGMRNLMLTTIGRRSGNAHTVVLPYWLDADGDRVVVASYLGGPHHPAWFHNLSDHEANPAVEVQDGDRVFRARADVLEDVEREAVWEALIADRPFYADYQAKTTRQIPLVRLVPLT